MLDNSKFTFEESIENRVFGTRCLSTVVLLGVFERK